MSHPNAKPIRFIEFENGCMCPISHTLNQDGYFRKMWNNKDEGWKRAMMHRVIWEAKHGEIPEGYEINHTCGCRACCNPEHLEMLDRNTHLVLTNKTRWKERTDRMKRYWEKGMSITELSEKYGVAVCTIEKYIKSWGEVH